MIMAFSTHQVMNTDGGLATAATAVVEEAGGRRGVVGGGMRRHAAAYGGVGRLAALRRYCMERMASSQLPLKHI